MRSPYGTHRLLVLAAALTLAACDRHHQDEPPAPVRPVLSLVVQPTERRVDRSFTGTVEPRYQAELGFQMTGRMISRDVNVGDVVHKGQQLATLDPVVARLALTSTEADRANAQAQLTNAAATLLRQQALIKTESVSQAQLDAAVAARDTAQAKFNQTEASLAKVKEQLGYTVLTSDHDGIVARWSAEVGQVVSLSQTVVTIARPDQRDAVLDVSDDLLDRFPVGARFSVHLLADDGVTAPGEVREIAPQSDAATLTRRIRLTLTDPGVAFRLGTTIRVSLAQTAGAQIVLPDVAILTEGQQTTVWLVGADGTVSPRPVTLGARTAEGVTVTAGLAAGERVVVAGVHSLSKGQAVKSSASEP
ncbi:efflux RND transporter periplasmic adaptor subunit [Lichenihabitans sp. Uapishka_5]|uniref:efflux RND transporter periplasmic adaptor subunit n=1 Tax=Lichenihabitans sp. Uapishka_5 TaxID=3037302 RepID=UPI0029E7F797|nr:efflux RND transporter periplasmic adaptor subunit [Lichenihabitans sp. Uapishka_5]MDX7949583.1 efflux RND transporter periplasmic adaptor subunit [Lichenihabitans sp. Uapishka_5]